MEINLLKPKDIKINSYGKNLFLISGKRYTGPVLILKNKILKKKNLKPSDVKINFLKKIILENNLDFLILGADEKVNKNINSNKNLKIELMSTSAACRTINILFSEERNIGALLFPIN